MKVAEQARTARRLKCMLASSKDEKIRCGRALLPIQRGLGDDDMGNKRCRYSQRCESNDVSMQSDVDAEQCSKLMMLWVGRREEKMGREGMFVELWQACTLMVLCLRGKELLGWMLLELCDVREGAC